MRSIISSREVGSTADAAKPSSWTPSELELVVKDYFATLDEEVTGGDMGPCRPD